MYTHSSETEQAFEITMTPALCSSYVPLYVHLANIVNPKYMLPSLCSAVIRKKLIMEILLPYRITGSLCEHDILCDYANKTEIAQI